MLLATYNLSKSKINIKPQSIAFEVYPDEQDITGIKALENIEYNFIIHALCGFVSPLHNNDCKSHFHVIIIRPIRCGFTYSTWVSIANQFNAANGHIVVINDIPKYVRYLTHLDNPEKQQFDCTPYSFGDISYNDYCQKINSKEKILEDNIVCLSQIIEWINLYHIVYFHDLVDYSLEQKNDWFPCIKSNSTFLISYLRSKEYESKQRYLLENRNI